MAIGVFVSAAAKATVLTCRKRVLPLINKRWARALRGPSHTWRAVKVGSSTGQVFGLDAAAKYSNATKALAWFKSRPG